MFFAISTFFELVCVLLYAFVFPKLPIVKYYRSKAASEGSKTVTADLAAGGIQASTIERVLLLLFSFQYVKEVPQYSRLISLRDKAISFFQDGEDPKLLQRKGNKQLLLENIDYALEFLIYVLTLSIFPGFLFEDTGSHSFGPWYALVLIATYNVCDLIGRFIPLLKFLEMECRKLITIAILSRFLLIPAFYFVPIPKYGDQGWMVILTAYLGLSNGYLTVCVLTAAPKGTRTKCAGKYISTVSSRRYFCRSDT